MLTRTSGFAALVGFLLLHVPVIANTYRVLDPADTVYLDLPDGRIVVELETRFAPQHVAQFKALVRKGFYDSQPFYRVIEGFVAQAGDGSDLEGEFVNPLLKAEFERPWADTWPYQKVEAPDFFAPETGFSQGFAVGRERSSGASWLVHCPGVIAMARNNGADTASTDFYIVIGQAPRYLDRNLTIFGRVVVGMDVVQRIRRGPGDADGVIPEEGTRTQIVRAVVAGDLPKAQQLVVEVTDTESEAFGETLEARRHRTHEFFHRTPPPKLDVCQVPVLGRVAQR